MQLKFNGDITMSIEDLTLKKNPVFDELSKLISLDLYPFNELSEKQLAFVLFMHHGPYVAAAKAGYGNPADALKRLKASSKVSLAIELVRQYIVDVSIADSVEVLQSWTKVLRDDNSRPSDVLAAGNLLAKAHGMMAEKIIIDKHVKKETIHVNINVDLDDPTKVLTIPLEPESDLKSIT